MRNVKFPYNVPFTASINYSVLRYVSLPAFGPWTIKARSFVNNPDSIVWIIDDSRVSANLTNS